MGYNNTYTIQEAVNKIAQDGIAVTGTGGTGTSAAQALPASTSITALQTAAVATGNGTSLSVTGMVTFVVAVSGITTATIVLEGKDPLGNWQTLRVKTIGTNTISSSITADGTYEAQIAGLTDIRARISAYTSGTINVSALATAGTNKAGVQSVAINDKLDKDNDSASFYEKGWTPVSLTASGQILGAPGSIKGFFVNSTTAGTIRFSDALTSTTPFLGGAITPAAGNFYPFPALCVTGGYATITGTLDVTVFVRAGTQA